MDKEKEINIGEIIKNNYKCDIIFNEEEPYVLYSAIDIGKILNISNIRILIQTFNNNYKTKIRALTNRGPQIKHT